MNSERVTITIPSKFLEESKKEASKKGMSLSGYVRYAISELKRKELKD